MPTKRHRIFRFVWWSLNVLLAAVVVSLVYTGVREYSVRRYLDGFSNAIVPKSLSEEEKLGAVLDWMRIEGSRAVGTDSGSLAVCDPQITLKCRQLLNVGGTATNAFLNLLRSCDLRARRLLLLDADNNTKHVVTEVEIGGRWIIVDPTYRVIMKDGSGHYLTSQELQNPAVLAEAMAAIPNYPWQYTYNHLAQLRLARLGYLGNGVQRTLDAIVPSWEQTIDWSLLLERGSLLYLVLGVPVLIFFVLLRTVLAWYADNRLRIPRFHLREHAVRAGVAFFSAPEVRR